MAVPSLGEDEDEDEEDEDEEEEEAEEQEEDEASRGGGGAASWRRGRKDNVANSRCLPFQRATAPPRAFLPLSPSSPCDLIPGALSRLPLCSFALPAEWRTRVALFGRDEQRST
ncbi:hypothetical protein KM043_013531 [Ampulex compressa]|nr:hypothetical protein KM043_013531 [Ampulex compressa]